MTSLELSQTDRNLLDAVRIKTKSPSNADVLRKLIRQAYFDVTSNPTTKLSKETPIKSGVGMEFKLVESRKIINLKSPGAMKLRLLLQKRKYNKIKGNQYKMSDGTIVTL